MNHGGTLDNITIKSTVRSTESRAVTVAYLILAHTNPEQLARLVGALQNASPVVIHFDLRADAATYGRSLDLLRGRPKLTFVKRYACRWGGIGIVEATLSAIRGLVNSGLDFDNAILLSGSDYPIKSHQEIERFLNENQSREFIESALLTEPNRWSNHGGYYRSPDRMVRRHIRFRSKVLFRLPGQRRLPIGLQPYGGSQWWCLSKDAIHFIAEFNNRVPQLLSFCRQSFIPDECYLQTVLSNSPLRDRIISDDLRVVIWDRPTPPYPAVLTIKDLDMLLSSKKLFARKFDSHMDHRVLDALDRRNSEMNLSR